MATHHNTLACGFPRGVRRWSTVPFTVHGRRNGPRSGHIYELGGTQPSCWAAPEPRCVTQEVSRRWTEEKPRRPCVSSETSVLHVASLLKIKIKYINNKKIYRGLWQQPILFEASPKTYWKGASYSWCLS